MAGRLVFAVRTPFLAMLSFPADMLKAFLQILAGWGDVRGEFLDVPPWLEDQKK